MAFWLFAFLMTLIVLVSLLGTFLRKGPAPDAAETAFDMQVYRDQLNELERDLTRGTLDADEAERARTEISRRLLGADRTRQASAIAGTAPSGVTYAAVGLSAALILIGGFGLYSRMGAIQTGANDGTVLPMVFADLPLKARIATAQEIRETRPSQAAAEAQQPQWPGPPAEAPDEYLELIGQLRTAVADRPDDLQGHELLSSHEARLGNYVAAHQAKSQAITLKADAAAADDFAQYADLLVQAAGGYVSPEAEAALTQAMRRDPKSPIARYYSGLMFAQIGRPDQAFRMWRDLLEEGPPDAPWNAPIRNQIMQLAAIAGVDYTLPEIAPDRSLAGPSSDDIEAAGEMSEQDRLRMIDGMVTRLSDRLATDGGSAQEWAQLLTALGVLGETDQATAVWAEAQKAFADHPDQLDIIREAAINAGVKE